MMSLVREKRSKYSWIAPLVVHAGFLAVCALSVGQTGVSDDRVSLPEGPGSLEGVGENVGMNPNMGTMSHRVAIEVPKGFAGVTPKLALSYSSGAGGSVVGMGWMLDTPYIERMTYRGLPRYDQGDDFSAGGGDQLVRLPNTDPPVYRSRYERGFVRYSWLDEGDGAEGFWKAEYPDGRVGYFGADARGTVAPQARVSGPDGTFRYMLVEMVDVHGHRMVYSYGKYGNVSLVEQIGYVFTVGDSPRYSVRFAYEPREDDTGVDFLSDAKCGFNELLTERLARISVFSGAEQIRQYRLGYERYSDSGGFTRLASVEQFGLEGERYPVVWRFGYSKALGGICDGNDCEQPFVVEMGSLGVDISTGRATLLDINGDALPDVVDTSEDGPHRFFINRMDAQGQNRFDTQPVRSTVGTRGGHPMDSGPVQVLDANGDGFTDMINAQTGEVLINKGRGDWEMMTSENTGGLPSFDEDFDDGELRTIRFLDYDNDKKIDVLRSNQETTTVFRNLGNGQGFAVDNAVMPIGAGFAEDNLQSSDMNGDGLLDMVRLAPGQISYRLNLGWGQWGDWVDILGLPIGEDEVPFASLEDLNGDGLSDLAVVVGAQVKYAINRNSTAFQAITTLSSADVQGALPQREQGVSVLYADMNGNGSIDIVWIDASGAVTFLELFPVRPNQLSRIENGLGMVQEITYGTSVQHMARDAEVWTHKLPHPMLVVDRIDEYDLLTNVHDITDFSYHNGFYDGLEKQFRGYERVEARLLGDDSQEEGLTITVFDVGAEDPYRKGLMVHQKIFSADRELRESLVVYDDCPVAEVSEQTALAVRHVCEVQKVQLIKEGADPDEHVRIDSLSEYDGYGNITLASQLGVTQVGGAGCEPCQRDESEFGQPCGTECRGDELYTETSFVPTSQTSGRWIINAPYRQRSYGREGSAQTTETLTYYDGEAFEGLPLGNLTRGLISKKTSKIEAGSDAVINTVRNRFDAHGNVIETLDPNGSPDVHAHRRETVFDDEGLRIIQTDLLLQDPAGTPYVLRRETQYEPVFDKLIEATSWMRVVDEQVLSSRRSTSYIYDQFARLTARIKPGQDSIASPTEAYQYNLGNPSSQIIIQQRSVSGQPFDQETIKCLDGRGRIFQERVRLEEDKYQVSGFTFFNTKSVPREIFQPYIGDSAVCDSAPPDGVLSTLNVRDSMGRITGHENPDESIYGSASRNVLSYLPLKTLSFDGEDSDPMSPHHNTPVVTTLDGLGRLVARERTLGDGLTPARIEVHYDELGRMTGYTDSGGHRKRQHLDLLGRVTRLEDPNSPKDSFYVYDFAGNTIETRDGRGAVVTTRFDGANRPVERFDKLDPDATRIQWFYDVTGACEASECTFVEGRLAQTSYPGLDGERAVDRKGYDVRGRLILSGRALAGVSFEHNLSYDNSDRLVSIAYPDGQVVERAYDDASRITSIENIVHTIDYDDRGLLSASVCADGSGSRRRYDAMMRLESLETTGPGEVLYQGFSYRRDRVGNILQIDDLTPPIPDRPRADALFSHDAWYRLTEAHLEPGGLHEERLLYGFDALDNIVSKTSSLGDASPEHKGDYAYTSDAPNALTQLGDTTLRYDDAGHMIARGDLGLTWDHLGRMTRAENSGREVGRFVYGDNQSRVARIEGHSTTLYISPDFEVQDGISTLYVRMDKRRVARMKTDALATAILSDLAPLGGPDDQINAADAWVAHARTAALISDGGDTGSTVESLLLSSARRALLETGEPTVYLHHDHLGSITMATSGDVIGHRAFYPTGTERADSFGHIDAYGFTGQERDASTGLVHFDWRYLDPDSGRWASIDPLFKSASVKNINRFGEATGAYGYVANNFIGSFDPTGLVRISATAAVSLAVSNHGLASGKSTKTVTLSKATLKNLVGAASKFIFNKAGGAGNYVTRKQISDVVRSALQSKAASVAGLSKAAFKRAGETSLGVGLGKGTIHECRVSANGTMVVMVMSTAKHKSDAVGTQGVDILGSHTGGTSDISGLVANMLIANGMGIQ